MFFIQALFSLAQNNLSEDANHIQNYIKCQVVANLGGATVRYLLVTFSGESQWVLEGVAANDSLLTARQLICLNGSEQLSSDSCLIELHSLLSVNTLQLRILKQSTASGQWKIIASQTKDFANVPVITAQEEEENTK